ncbi:MULTISPECIES: hypothetical protein [unclassified Deinococcus]|nr:MULTISPECIES: hypothetical protein [unclassified Deinococcus]
MRASGWCGRRTRGVTGALELGGLGMVAARAWGAVTAAALI